MSKKSSNLFAKLELDYADHPKIAPLSDAAFRMHIEMILYSRKYETDGIIKNRIANRMGLRWDTDVLTELATNDENSPSLIKLENGDYLINGYADVQETKAEIAARRAKNAQNGAKGGRPKKTQSVIGSVTESGTQTKAETETETEVKREGANKPPTPAKKRGARITADWLPQQETIQKLTQEFPHIDQKLEHRKFIDHWLAESGAKASKLDWEATYRNWIRRSAEYNPAPLTNAPSPWDQKGIHQ